MGGGAVKPVKNRRVINEAAQHPADVVTLMSHFLSHSCWLSVIDSAKAYFNIPGWPDSQFWVVFLSMVSFTHGWPQGFLLKSNTVCCGAENLFNWWSLCGSALAQYVNSFLCAVSYTRALSNWDHLQKIATYFTINAIIWPSNHSKGSRIGSGPRPDNTGCSRTANEENKPLSYWI